jgi:hypothetical protein
LGVLSFACIAATLFVVSALPPVTTHVGSAVGALGKIHYPYRVRPKELQSLVVRLRTHFTCALLAVVMESSSAFASLVIPGSVGGLRVVLT